MDENISYEQKIINLEQNYNLLEKKYNSILENLQSAYNDCNDNPASLATSVLDILSSNSSSNPDCYSEHDIEYQDEDAMEFICKLMNGSNDYFIVVEQITGSIIHLNSIAVKDLYYNMSNRKNCDLPCKMLQLLTSEAGMDVPKVRVFDCCNDVNTFNIKCYDLLWNQTHARAYLIINITPTSKVRNNINAIAYIDELTGCNNRRFCLETIRTWIDSRYSFCVAFVDMDRLKFVNEKYGHDMGDYYITEVVRRLNILRQDSDFLCRLGGDEFVLLVKNKTEDAIWKLLNTMQNELQNLEVGFPMNISFGVKFVDEHDEPTVSQVLKAADERMYAMKQQHKST